jgi:hypothetical protein
MRRPTKKSYKRRRLRRLVNRFWKGILIPNPLFEMLAKTSMDGGTYITTPLIYEDKR